MAKQINKDTVVSADYLDNAIKPLQEYIGLITQADKLLKEFAASMKSGLGFKTDAKGMREQENLQKKINSAYQQKIKLEKEEAKLRIEELRLQKAREKSIDDYNKKLQKEAELTKKAEQANVQLYEKTIQSIDKRSSQEQKSAAQREKQYNKELKAAENLARIKSDKEKSQGAKVEEDNLKEYEKFTKEVQKREAAEQKAHAKREAQYNKEIKQTEELNRPYNKLSTTLNNLRKEYRDLAVQGQENTKRGRELKGTIDQLDKSLKKVDADIGVYGRNVGNYTGAISRGFKSAMGVLQQFGLALGGIALARGAIDTIVTFDAAIADLSAITGATDTQLDFFRKNAIELGKDVKGGASAVVEAYKLIGSAKPELLENASALNEVTKATILLSKASGMELPDAATAMTDAMNQFGAGADQATKFVDVLAAGAKFGAAEIPQITEALLRFGAVAKTSNVNIQESTALIEDLAEKGLKGADAGTALRNVMLKLSAPDALPKEAQARLKALGINFDVLRDKSLPFSKRLEALKPLLKDNAALVKTFGTENAVAATTLISTTDRIADLTNKLDENGVAQDQADARSKTLSEAFNKLKETFNSMVLEFASGNNVAGGFIDFLDFIRENLPTIIKLTFEFIKAIVIFKGVMASLRLVDQTKNFIAFRKAVKAGTVDMTEASAKAKGFGQMLKGIGWTVAIDLAFQLGSEIWRIANGAAQAAEDLARMNAQRNLGAGVGEKAVSRELKEQNKQFEKLERDARRRIQNGESEKKVNEELLKQKEKIIAKTNDDLRASIRSSNSRKEDFKAQLKEVEDIQKKFAEKGYNTKKEYDRLVAIQKEIKLTGDDVYLGLIENQGDATDIAAQLKANISGVNEQLISLTGALDENSGAFEDNKLDIRDVASEYSKAGKKIEDYTMRVRELRDAQIKESQSREEAQLRTKLAADLAAINANGIKANEYRIELERTYQADLLKLQKEYVVKRIEAEYEYWDAVREAQLQAKADYENIENEKYNQEIKAITDRDKQLELQSLQNGKNGQRTDEAIEADKLKRKKESLKQQIETARFYGLETIDMELELARLERDQKKAADDKERTRLEAMAKFRNQLIQKGTDYLATQIDKQIELLNKREQKANDLENFLQEAATQGNIKAEQSIVEQQRIQEESDRKKMELEEKKARIVALGAILQTYNNKTSAGDKNALASTVVESGALLAFLQGFDLPGFYSGTDDTGKGGNVDSKGGFTAVLHPNEQVWSKDDRKEVGFKSRQEIKDAVRIADQFNTGNMVYRDQFQGASAGNSFDIVPMLRKQDEMISAINSLPDKDLDVEQLAQGIVLLTATTRRPNLVKESQFKIRK